MKYKTTYFKIPLNKEISNSKEMYDFRINSQELLSEIIELENEVQKANKERAFDGLEIIGKTSQELLELKKSPRLVTSKIDELIRLKRIYENVNNQRYTTEDNELLNLHLEQNSLEDWKLHSMQPITKGLYKFGRDYDSAYGYGHNIIEGFIIVWEKP